MFHHSSTVMHRRGFRGCPGWSQTGLRHIAEIAGVSKEDLVARGFCLFQMKPLCGKVDLRKVFGGRGRGMVGMPPIGAVVRQSLYSFWSQNIRQAGVDQSSNSPRPFCLWLLPIFTYECILDLLIPLITFYLHQLSGITFNHSNFKKNACDIFYLIMIALFMAYPM